MHIGPLDLPPGSLCGAKHREGPRGVRDCCAILGGRLAIATALLSPPAPRGFCTWASRRRRSFPRATPRVPDHSERHRTKQLTTHLFGGQTTFPRNPLRPSSQGTWQRTRLPCPGPDQTGLSLRPKGGDERRERV